MDHPFRKAAVGGFNRQDVLEYLEKSAQEAAGREQALRDQLAQAEQEKDETAKDADTLRARVKELEEQVESLARERDEAEQRRQAQAEQSETDRKALEDRIAELELNQEEQDRQLTESRQARTQAEQRADALESDASAYAAIKDRTAGVELRAHQRARAVEDQADRQAQELRAQLEQWIKKINLEYDHLRSQVAAAVTHAGDQLNKAEECLGQVDVLLGRQESALEELAKVCAEPLPPRNEQ